MGINEMDFQWRLNWWYRPTQLDGFETSVVDYYDCFCDWKANMVLNSCPADEDDYVDAFIQNLRCNIRSRLESKGRPSTRRLSDAFYDAKLEESLIFIDEAFKKIKAKFEAHKLFDKLHIQVFVVYQENSSDEVDSCLHISSVDSCSNELAENLSDDEFSGLEDDESSCLEGGPSITKVLSVHTDSENETRKLFDELTEPILTASSDQVLGNVGYDSAIADETMAGDVDKVLESESNGGYDVKIVSPNADDTLFDELPKPALTTKTSYKLFDDDFNVYSGLNSQTRATFDQVLGSSGDEALKLINKSTGIQLMEKVEGSFFAKHKDLKIACKVFDEMPMPFFVEPEKEISGDVDQIPPLDYVPQVFDPGTSIFGGDLGAGATLNMPLPSFWMNNELIQPSTIQTAKYKVIEKGEGVYSLQQNPQTEPALEFDKSSEQAFTGLNSFCGNFYSISNIEEVEILSLKARVNSSDMSNHSNVELLVGNMLFLFDPGGSSWFHYSCVSLNMLGGIIDLNGVSYDFDITMGKPDGELWVGKMLLFIFDPGGYLSDHKGCSFFKSIQFNSCASLNPCEMSSHSNVESWVEGMVFLFDPVGCVSTSSIQLSLTPWCQPCLETMALLLMTWPSSLLLNVARQPLAQCSQASTVCLKWQISCLSEIKMVCYTFIIVLEQFVWDSGTTLVVVPFTSLRTMMFFKGNGKDMEDDVGLKCRMEGIGRKRSLKLMFG